MDFFVFSSVPPNKCRTKASIRPPLLITFLEIIMFQCIISRASKIQVYKTLIRPVATYGTGTWTLPVVEENALRMFERKIILRIYGLVLGNNVCRIR
jgi:hypothetical protein